MKPILYAPTETAFDTNGIGILADAISGYVYEELNGQFELEMQYPVEGIHFKDIALKCYLTAKPDPVKDDQIFRIYRITKPMNGIVTIYARHLAYRQRGIVVSPFTADSCPEALVQMKANAVTDCPFNYWTDKSTATQMAVKVPKNIWKLLGGSKGSLLDTYGGEYEFDNFDVKLHSRRGADRGVSIRYGKNLTSLEQDANCANVYTGVYPFWTDTEGNLVMLPEKIIRAEGTYPEDHILDLDLSDEFETQPTEDELRARAEKYMKDNDIGVPVVSWKVEFVQLEQTEEYKGMALLERVLLGDTVSVEFPKMGVSASARAVAAKYNFILERWEYVTLGKVKSNLADTIVKQQQEIEKKPSQTLVHSIVVTLTAGILGARGGAVRLLDTDGDGMPDTLYVADNPDPALAVKVWRWNYEGWAGSKTGYNGPFTLGATLEDGLLAEAVTAARLVAGTIQSADGESFFVDLDNGIVKIKAVSEQATAIEGIRTEMATIDARADGITSEVSNQAKELENLREDVTTVQQTASNVNIQVQSIIDNGVDKVKTKMGYSFDDEGLHIAKDGDEIESLLDNRGLYVARGDQVMLKADADGVEATDVKVNNYLIIAHSRFEKYSNGTDTKRTGLFWVKEG